MSTAVFAPAVRPSVATDLTPEELAWMNGPGREGRYEWVDGRAVKKPMSYDANLVAAKIIIELGVYLRRHPIGDVLIEQEYQCFPAKPRQVRKPDISLVLHSRVSTPHPRGFLRFVPDLAVEVISPNDLVYGSTELAEVNVDEKLEDYRSAGFPLVWVVNPDSRLVRIHTPGQDVVERRGGDMLDASELLPGFGVKVEALMPAVLAAET